MQGDRRIVLVTQFAADVANPGDHSLKVKAQIGVSQPSEVDYPMRPYVVETHSVAEVEIAPHSSTHLTVLRMDVIDPNVLATPIPWRVVGTPSLVPQIFGPQGTPIPNAALIMYLGG
jgi:hypothetical protein